MSKKTVNSAVKRVLDEVIKIAIDKKSENIRYFSVSEKMWMTDYILIVEINNKIHGKALCAEIKDKVSKLVISLKTDDFYEDFSYAGQSDSDWIVLDLNSIVVHCITEELNDYYKLDELFEKYGPVFHS
ncbi:ribosome silencing factor [Candidatus Marinamargulisbacteria bacterium SCGC AAA071-K20]|nr:ribosome silencing factor [Candidatus Marinamargulisbacteria bacterium SCGC AAA071-K20]